MGVSGVLVSGGSSATLGTYPGVNGSASSAPWNNADKNLNQRFPYHRQVLF
jgi:hypothetical protein